MPWYIFSLPQHNGYICDMYKKIFIFFFFFYCFCFFIVILANEHFLLKKRLAKIAKHVEVFSPIQPWWGLFGLSAACVIDWFCEITEPFFFGDIADFCCNVHFILIIAYLHACNCLLIFYSAFLSGKIKITKLYANLCYPSFDFISTFFISYRDSPFSFSGWLESGP